MDGFLSRGRGREREGEREEKTASFEHQNISPLGLFADNS
jgi:hypothetical protein